MSFGTNAASTLARALSATRSGRLVILIYHRVLPRRDPMLPGEVDSGQFDWQMALLRRYCNPVSLEDGVAGLQAGRLPPRAVAVTFDDGYRDNSTVALPILLRHGVPATFFIAPGYLNGGRMWNDSIIETVRRAQGRTVDTGRIGLGELSVLEPQHRVLAADSIIKAVKHLPPDRRVALVDELSGRLGVVLPNDLMMTDDQVRQLALAGMEIGAHTMTHPILRLLSDEEARREIQDSREALEGMLGRRVRAFAYPNGRPYEDYTNRDRNIVESLGFSYALSTRWGAGSRWSDLYQLPRFTPWNRSPSIWLLRLLAAFRMRS